MLIFYPVKTHILQLLEILRNIFKGFMKFVTAFSFIEKRLVNLVLIG